ncbi:hypothetical protein ACFL6W_09555 [Thermodesulfobacteriota bacterium]
MDRHSGRHFKKSKGFQLVMLKAFFIRPGLNTRQLSYTSRLRGHNPQMGGTVLGTDFVIYIELSYVIKK